MVAEKENTMRLILQIVGVCLTLCGIGHLLIVLAHGGTFSDGFAYFIAWAVFGAIVSNT
jgi:hypothetical protein